jgi:hypothetical protein
MAIAFFLRVNSMINNCCHINIDLVQQKSALNFLYFGGHYADYQSANQKPPVILSATKQPETLSPSLIEKINRNTKTTQNNQIRHY